MNGDVVAQVWEALNRLGTFPEQVAESLAAAGVDVSAGALGNPGDCAVARYVRLVVPAAADESLWGQDGFGIGMSFFGVATRPGRRYPLPAGVVRFLRTVLPESSR